MIVDQTNEVVAVTSKSTKITLKLIMQLLKKVADTIERSKTEVSQKSVINKAKDLHVGIEEVNLGSERDKVIAIRNQLAKDGIYFNIQNDGHGEYTLTCLAPYSPHASQVINKTIKDFEDKEKRINNLEKFKAAKIVAKDKKIEVLKKIKDKTKNRFKETREER